MFLKVTEQWHWAVASNIDEHLTTGCHADIVGIYNSARQLNINRHVK